MKCAYCKYNDGSVYTSNPPKYRCSVTGEYHLALDDCNVEFAPVKHGRWVIAYFDNVPTLAACNRCDQVLKITRAFEKMPNYCPNCGTKMDEVEE